MYISHKSIKKYFMIEVVCAIIKHDNYWMNTIPIVIQDYRL